MSTTAPVFRPSSMCACASCGSLTAIRQPGWPRRAAVGTGWVMVAALAAACSLTGPFMLMLLPVLFPGAMCLISSLYRWVDPGLTCGECRGERARTGEEERAEAPRALEGSWEGTAY